MIFDNDALNFALWTVVAVGALNWGLVAGMDYNLLTDGLGIGSDMAELAYLGIGGAGAINLVDLASEVM
jgi:uncharacterized membrane protein YuzA (DUF378 family)